METKNVIIFWCIALGIGRPYVFIIWSKMSFSNIDGFQLMMGGVVGGATLKALLTWASSMSYNEWYMLHAVLY
jgi:hypothetical protein